METIGGGVRSSTRRGQPRRQRPARLDVDTVRLERTDSSQDGWRVVAGDRDDPVLVGFLEPVYSVSGRRSGRWQARTTGMTLVPSGPWRNRIDATARLVDSYQRVSRR